MKLAFIGGGNMGEAMLSAILAQGLSKPQDISVSDISETRRRYLKQKYSVAVTSDNKKAVDGAEVVVLAIKPQNLAEVMADLNGELKPAQLVLSIIAGATLKTLSSGLKHNRIVRVMPNTPAQIGEGMSVWTATAEVTEKQRERASSILGAIGREIYVDDEKYLDMATAVSGSGPAYFFLFVEALVEAAVHIGLSRNMAQELVLQTMLGSGHLIQKSGKAPAELRRMVTSPGGTTAEALAELDKGGFTNLVIKAVNAAYNKAKRLGGEQK
jgi:pyrroline-5-carboxylate reductase